MSLLNREELLRRLKLHGRRKDGKTVIPEWMQVAIKEVEHMPEVKPSPFTGNIIDKATIAAIMGIPENHIESLKPYIARYQKEVLAGCEVKFWNPSALETTFRACTGDRTAIATLEFDDGVGYNGQNLASSLEVRVAPKSCTSKGPSISILARERWESGLIRDALIGLAFILDQQIQRWPAE